MTGASISCQLPIFVLDHGLLTILRCQAPQIARSTYLSTHLGLSEISDISRPLRAFVKRLVHGLADLRARDVDIDSEAYVEEIHSISASTSTSLTWSILRVKEHSKFDVFLEALKQSVFKNMFHLIS